MAAFPAPAPGDIVWCKFPNRENIHPAKPRPALILSVMDGMDPVRVRVAYGTSQGVARISNTELLIGPENAAAYAVSGLSRATKICLTNVVVLEYTDFWFGIAPGITPRTTPQMGVLHPSLMRALQAAAVAARLL